MRQILVTKKLAEDTDIQQLIDAVQANAVPIQGETSEGETPQAQLAIVDGAALLDDDEDERRVLTQALDNDIPIIMKNASSEAVQAFTGVSVNAGAVLVQTDKQGGGASVTPLGDEGAGMQDGSSSASEGETEDQASTEAGLQAAVLSTTSAETAASSAAVGGPVSVSAMADTASQILANGGGPAFLNRRPDLPEGAYRAFFVNMSEYEWSNKRILQNGGSGLNLGLLVELYAVDYPKCKYVVVSTVGAGITMGVPDHNSWQHRGYYLQSLQLGYGPSWIPSALPNLLLERMAPESENKVSNISNLTGFTTGVSRSETDEMSTSTSVNASLTDFGAETEFSASHSETLGVSSSWDESTSASFEISNFETHSYAQEQQAFWKYRLASLKDGTLYYGPTSLDDGANLRELPIIAYTNLPIHTQAVWRFPHDMTKTVPFALWWWIELRDVWRENGSTRWNWSWRSRWDPPRTFDVDLSSVRHERSVPILPKPRFLSTVRNQEGLDDLVFYRPMTNSLFYLKSKGDGTFEPIHTRINFETLEVYKPDEEWEPSFPPYLAQHTVQRGESLSLLAYKYYRSMKRDDWQRIYEANKDVIGDNPSLIKVGQQLKIPYKSPPGA